MGFIEELARKRQLAVQERQAKEAQKSNREEQLNRERRDQESRVYEAKQRALHSSVVPEMSRRLQNAARVDFDRSLPAEHALSGIGGKVVVGTSYDTKGGKIELTRSFIHVEGQVDGSVTIGRTRLSATEARDPSMVDQALGRAYNSSKSETIDVTHPEQPSRAFRDR